MNSKETIESLLVGFVVLAVGLALYPTLNSFVNSLYTASAINSTTGFAHSSQGLLPIVSLLYLIAVILVSVGMIAVSTFSTERLGGLSEKMTKVLMGFIVIIIGLSLAGILLSFGQTAYTNLGTYTWGTGYQGLVQIVILLYIVAILVVGAVEMIKGFLH